MTESKALLQGMRVRTPARVRADWLSHAVVALIFSGALLAYVQFAGPNIVDYDGYYHIKTAQLIREQGLPLAFPWLKFTILEESRYTDHHMLLHVFQMPFTFIGDLRLAAKLAPVALAALAFTIFYLVLRRYEIGYPLLWLIVLFASSSPFLYRMSMARGQSLSLALQLIAFHLIMRRDSRGLLVLTIIFVWSYNAFPLLIPIVLFGAITDFISEKRIEYKTVLAVGAGIIAGHVLNPYFPNNVLFIWDHIMPKLLATDYQTTVGTEWYPFSSWTLVTTSLVAVLSYLGGIFLTDRAEWKQDRPRLFWFLVSTMYLVLLFKSRRFVEYFPPSAVMFLAFASRERLKNLEWTLVMGRRARAAVSILMTVVLWLAAYSTIEAARKEIDSEPATIAYKGGAEWLAANSPAGSTVFHTDWDDFPKLFFYNTRNTYILGLDPDFMRLENERLYYKYEDVTRGRIQDMEDFILKELGCEYVFTDNEHREFMSIADQSPRMRKVYSDRHATVYRVLEKAPDTKAESQGHSILRRD
jgi:asparagine N-glycosylation enzyme membrane subunit Stt3